MKRNLSIILALFFCSFLFILSSKMRGEEEVKPPKKDDWKVQPADENEDEEDAEDNIWQVIEKKRLDIDFQDKKLSEAILILAKQNKINIILDMALQKKNPTITLNVKKMRLENVLYWIGQLSGTSYRIDRGAVFYTEDKAKDLDPKEKIVKMKIKQKGIEFELSLTRVELDPRFIRELPRMFMRNRQNKQRREAEKMERDEERRGAREQDAGPGAPPVMKP